MRFFAPVVALFAAVATAQNNTSTGSGSTQANAVNIPASGRLDITAGSNTITWANPSSGTVTIKLQTFPGPNQPDDGITVASDVESSDGTATFDVPADAVVPGQFYTIQIVDDTGAEPPNYSNEFTVSGATGSATTSAASTSASATESMTSGTASATTSGTATTRNPSSTSGAPSRTTTAGSSATSPTVPGAANKVAAAAQGGLFVFMAAVVAIL